MRIYVCIGAAVCLQMAGWAADIKPFDAKLGLWESTSTTEMGGMPAMPAMPQIPPETLAKMPPAQRAQVEAMMKGRGPGGPRSNTTKYCLTKESLEKAMAFAQGDKSCTPTVVSSSSSKQEIHMDCTREGTHMTGDVTVERVDAEHAKGAMKLKAEGDHPITINSTFQSKWLSSDCGDVKPAMAK